MRMIIFDEGGLAKCIRDIRQLSEYTYANLTDDAGYTAMPIDELIASIIHIASAVGQVNGHLLGALRHECIEEFRSEIIDTFFIPDMVTVALDAKVDAIILAMAAIFNAHYVTGGCFKLVQQIKCICCRDYVCMVKLFDVWNLYFVHVLFFFASIVIFINT